MKRDMWFLALIVGALALVMLLFRGFSATAETPGVFSDGYTLEQANRLSEETGKPVFALATADWCGPCQTLKRGPLTDPGIVAFLRERTIPVYLEESASMDEIRSLPVRAYPTTIVLRNGQITGQIEGGGSAEAYFEMVRDAVGDAG